MTTTVTVYSRPGCVQCDATKRTLDRKGIVHVDLELEDHPDVLKEAIDAGHLNAPIVTVERGNERRMWGGFRHALLEELPYLIKENK